MFHFKYSASCCSTDEVKSFSPLVRTHRIPMSMQACPMASGVRYISKTEVMPEVRYSKTASLVKW